MDISFLRSLAVICGLLIGLQIWSRTVRWIHSIWLAFRPSSDAATNVPLSLPVLLFLHSAPWLLAAFAAVIVYILSTPHKPEWAWFFGGAFATPLLIALNLLWYFHRKRKSQLRRAQP